MWNEWVGIGYVGADPEIRNMDDGRKVANFRLATSESWRDKQSGERKERTTWHSIVVWNQHLIDGVMPYIKKGSLIMVNGPILEREYEDKDGAKRWIKECVLNFDGKIKLMPDGKKDGSGRPPHAESPEDGADIRTRDSRGGEAMSSARTGTGTYLDDELPF